MLTVILRNPRLERTLPFQLVSAAAFGLITAPLAATAAPLTLAWLAAGAWTTLFAGSAVAIYAVKARRRAPTARPPAALAVAAALLGLAAGALLTGGVAAAAGGSLLPGAATTAWLATTPVGPRHLKRVGWLLAAALTVSLLVLTTTLS